MSIQYDNYIREHRDNVIKAWNILSDNLPREFIEKYHVNMDRVDDNIILHDKSKFDEEEYDAYDKYFYRDPTDKFNVLVLSGQIDRQADFDKAWLHHQHHNPHHWQHWVLRNDDGNTKILDMDIEYILEMICDWWSFSLKKNQPLEIIQFYKDNESTRILSNKTKVIVLEILDIIKTIKTFD